MTISNIARDERGCLVNFDEGRSTVSLDRATGDGIGMMVDEKGDFAGILLNYNPNRIGSYRPAVQIDSVGKHLTGSISNFKSSVAGSIKAGEGGRATISYSEAR